MTESEAETFDIVICGGGFVGLALARALTAMAPGAYSIAIVERRPMGSGEAPRDGRTVALTSSVKAMLEVTGVWEKLADKAQPVLRIELTDSSLEAPVRPPLIGLDASEAPDAGPTAYVVENADLAPALTADLPEAPDVKFLVPETILSFRTSESHVEIRLGSGKTLRAKLLVAADGGQSKLRELAGIGAVTWRSKKTGIVATLGTERPHHGIAQQHFLPAGPFASLPMTGNRVSVVWTEDAAEADRILALGRDAVLAAIGRRIGTGLGALTLLSEPKTYPLTMTFARDFVAPRLALVGDAAHSLHWIAGQGLNHGFKDVAALSETLIDASRLGLDIGGLSVLKRYERWRRFDSASSAATGLAINALFSNGNIALRMLRSSGLRTADKIGRLKVFFMKEAAGLTGELPKMLRGQPV